MSTTRVIVGTLLFLGACSAGADKSTSESATNGAWDPTGSTGSSAGEACDEPGQTRACYEGPDETRGVGLCVEGLQTCAFSGEFATWGECVGDVTPSDTPTGTCECAPESTNGSDSAPDNSAALCGGAHSECDCAKAGGEVVDIGEGCRICRFDAAECPADFTNYDNWRTTVDGTDCGTAVQTQTPTGRGGAEEDCPPFVPAVMAGGTTYMLSCDRQADYCCGTPPDPATVQQPKGHPWSSHVPEETSFVQGYNPCGCACGPETCTVGELFCVAVTTQIGCS